MNNIERLALYLETEIMKKLLYFIVSIFTLASCLPTEEPANAPETVESVDFERYSGLWYEIASYPQIFEIGCNCVTATYGALPNGNVSVVNTCTRFFPGGPQTDIAGQATIVPNSGNAKLNVAFFGGTPPDDAIGNYWVIGLADDYSWALISDPFRNTFWILSRTAQMEDQLYNELLDLAVEKGFKRTKIKKMNQGC